MTDQTGTYRHGMYGGPVFIHLTKPGDPPVPLAGVTSITLLVRRPNSTQFQRSLPLPDAIADAVTGVVRYVVQLSDLPVAGTYRMVLTINFAAARHIVDAVMQVS